MTPFDPTDQDYPPRRIQPPPAIPVALGQPPVDTSNLTPEDQPIRLTFTGGAGGRAKPAQGSVQPSQMPVAKGAPGEQSSVIPMPQVGQPGETMAARNLRDLQQSGSRISQVKNPVGHALLGIGDALLGTFAPRAERLIPGTEGNYGMRLGRAERAVAGERAGEKEASEAEERSARAAEERTRAENPPKAAKPDIHELYAEAVKNAIDQGVDPATDPNVKQTLAALTAATAKEPQEKENLQAMLAEATRDAIKNGRDPAADPQVKQIIGVMQTSAKPAAEKEGELPIGDDRAASDNAGITALYREAGLPVPPTAQVNGKHTQKDEARILDLAKSEIAAHRQQQEFDQREKDRQVQRQIAQGNVQDKRADDAWKIFSERMTKELDPVQEQLANIREARALMSKSDAPVSQFLGTVKTLVSMAGGRGSGVRITQAELNGIPSARGIAGGFEGLMNQLAGKGKMSGAQVAEINRALGEVEALAAAKQERLNRYLDMGVATRDPQEFRRIEQQYRHEEMQAPAAAAQGGGGGRGTVPEVKNQADFNKLKKGDFYMEGGHRFQK